MPGISETRDVGSGLTGRAEAPRTAVDGRHAERNSALPGLDPRTILIARGAEALSLPLLIADPSGAVLAANSAWTELSGLSEGESVGRGWITAIEPRDAAALVTELAPPSPGGSHEYKMVGPGGWRWTRWWWRSAGRLISICVADVHEDRSREWALFERATRDPLSGLVNRSHFLEEVTRSLQRMTRRTSSVGVLFIDLDDFKQINDGAGHLTGDRVLAAVGGRLASVVRSPDVVARLGGDEFGVLCDDVAGSPMVETVARRIEDAISRPIRVEGRTYTLAGSIGIALAQSSAEEPEALLQRADEAMYRAKRQPRRTTRSCWDSGSWTGRRMR